METNTIITIISLFFGVWFTFVNVGRTLVGQRVPWLNMVIMAAAWTTFIGVMWLVP